MERQRRNAGRESAEDNEKERTRHSETVQTGSANRRIYLLHCNTLVLLRMNNFYNLHNESTLRPVLLGLAFNSLTHAYLLIFKAPI